MVSDLLWQAARAATGLLASLGTAGTAAPELAEATAALQDLACSLAPLPEQAGRLARLWELQNGLPAVIQAAQDGPYLVTNVRRVLNHLGEQVPATPQLALCRCGGSSMKPFCDGTHARNGFTDAKDPKRVPDRRDTYPGQQVTILDNRGLCQHSGFCTDGWMRSSGPSATARRERSASPSRGARPARWSTGATAGSHRSR